MRIVCGFTLYSEIQTVILSILLLHRCCSCKGRRHVCVDATEHVVCQSKYFRAKCSSPDELVLVQRARYGRMNLSKCVRENFGYIGCSNDVIDIVDSHCSGRRACSLRVLDENFMNMKPCHEDLKLYLSVKYSCVEGQLLRDRPNCILLRVTHIISRPY